MTGGQPVDGQLTVPEITRQLAAEGATQIVVVTDEPEKYAAAQRDFAPGVAVHHRDELDAVQRELREIAGRHGPDLRPDLRRREAPPPQARHVPRSRRSASSSTSWSAKAAATAACSRTACRSSRWRPSSAASAPSTSPPATRTFPASRASARASSRSRAARCASAEGRGARRRLARDAARARAAGARPSPTASSSPASAAPASSPSARCSAWPRISKARACAVLDLTGLAQKGGAVYSHIRIARHARGDPRRAHRRGRSARWCSAATSSWRPADEALAKMQTGVTTRASINTAR